LVIEDLVLRAPRADEARVKVAATAICHSDLHDMHGGEALRNVIVFS
jgi:Zn-dependent alcohol dehydrogenase